MTNIQNISPSQANVVTPSIEGSKKIAPGCRFKLIY